MNHLLKIYFCTICLILNSNSICADTHKQLILNTPLSLTNSSSVSLKPNPPISSATGSINAWIKPSKESEKKSKPILTFRWEDKKNGYLALSHGWWEQVSSNSIFFVVNNQEQFHCSIYYNLDIASWSMVTAVWKSGVKGYCKIYVDGILVAKSKYNKKIDYTSKGPLHIGNDKGSTDKRKRSFIGEIADLEIFNYALSRDEIFDYYMNPKYNNSSNSKNKIKWLDIDSHKKNSSDKTLENRVIFDPDIMWATSKENTDKILKKIKSAGFNTYVPYVWHGKGTFFYSKNAHLHDRLKKTLDGSYDPLEYLISEAHKLGIEVHPCLVITRREDNEYPEYYDTGTPKNAYNVHLPQFRTFIKNLLMEVVNNYDIDGINLDYIRTMGICDSDFCIRNYHETTSHDFNKDYYLRFISSDSRKRIQSWQDYAINDIVENFSKSAKKIKPNLIISVDAHPTPTGERRPLNGRNSVAWANSGLIDVIFSMDYNKKMDYEKADRIYNSLKTKQSFIPLFANYDIINGSAIRRPGNIVNKYVNFSRNKWPRSGFAVYLLHQMSDEQVKSLSNDAFSTPSKTNWPTR